MRYLIPALVLLSASPAIAAESRDIGAPPVSAVVEPPALNTRPALGARPAYGYRLPAEWRTSAFYLADPRVFRLPKPARGFGWSRYQGYAVLTDQWGRVYDSYGDVDWNRPRHRRTRYLQDAPHWSAYGDDSAPGEVVTTVVTRREEPCTMVPRQVVTYENVYAPVRRAVFLPASVKERRTIGVRPRVRGGY